jgi:type IV pilus assembly protein PilM
MVHTLSERRGLTAEHANQWLGHVGLHAPLDAIDGDADLVSAARSVLEEGVHQLADTVRNSLNFYRMQESAEQVETGVLTGPAVAIPGFVESLSESLRLPLEPAVVASQDEAADLGRLTVAAGLAVEQVS